MSPFRNPQTRNLTYGILVSFKFDRACFYSLLSRLHLLLDIFFHERLSFFLLPHEDFYSSLPTSSLSTSMGTPVPGARSGGFEVEPSNGC
jgi:hypothetical protein